MSVDDSERFVSRRAFLLRAAATSGAALCTGEIAEAFGSVNGARSPSGTPARPSARTVISFYVDDTNPYVAGADAFKKFLDFVAAEGIAGESSMILGFGWEQHGLLSNPQTAEQRAYVEQLHRAFQCGIDSHMELMTHGGRFDFKQRRVPQGVQHEGIWLHEPEVSADEYEAYFANILAEGKKIGVRFTGVTWPGCERRTAELFGGGPLRVNPNVWRALLSLAKQGKFRGPTVPCFILGGKEEQPLTLMAGDGNFGVYNLYPNAEDQLGIWENNPARVNPDYYITADGKSGRIVEKILAGSPRCVFYAHWQGVNPVNGVGWQAFQQVVQRINKHYRNRVTWMRPSALTDAYHRQAAEKNG